MTTVIRGSKRDTMPATTIARAFRALVPWLFVPLVAQGCSSTPLQGLGVIDHASISNVDVIVCGTLGQDVAPNGRTHTRREWYSLTALNGKLRHFPDFAALAGIETVTDCDEARAVMTTYVEYSRLHPAFDATQPLEYAQRSRPEEPVRPPGAPAPFILNGTPGSPAPVVQIETDSGACTGTFIAKNFIATAAHCFAVLNPQATSAPGALNGQTTATITFFGPDGSPIGSPLTNIQILQYANPSYPGPSSAQFPQFDFGLVFIPRWLDGSLPPDPDGLVPGQGPFMRIGFETTPSTNSVLWGRGKPNSGTMEQTPYGPAAPLSFSGTVVTGHASSNGPFPCEGDSGGPIVEQYTIPNDPAGTEPVLVAAHSSHDDSACSGDCSCTGSSTFEISLVTQITFIEDTMKQWYGKDFECHFDKAIDPAGAPFIRCWGDKCQTTSDCDPAAFPPQTCINSGSSLSLTQQCTACGSTSCSCIFGQCL